ncbi:DoxX family protein [Shewanella sp. HN-41]|uniref:DoxX family protein n=1 Tax=Shewanella sp. HN-41 TaxID=327275 RepID=UPI0002126740|nr:DoxX family protein [Shewanella sp. HN-41]EGM69537.1 hypothetical protein SOHN41_02380 [Shewanella sp. HN-41]
MAMNHLCLVKGYDGKNVVDTDPQQLFICANTLNRAAVAVTLAMSIVFLFSGMGKLLSVPFFHVPFTLMNLPTGFGYFIGVIEVVGAIGIGWREYRVLSATALLSVMMGAIYYHFNYETTLSALPALSLSALLFLTIKLDESVDRLVRFQRQLIDMKATF